MSAMKLMIPLIAAALLAGSAYVHGRLTDRWGVPTERLDASQKVSQLPLVLGDWEGTDFEMGDQELAIANVNSYISRRYVHKYNRAEVSILLVCGRPGSVGAHPPEVCYAASGYANKDKATRPSGDDATWIGLFTRDHPNPDSLRIVWAWGTAGRWTASVSPRTQYAANPYLYKFYVIQRVPTTPGARDDESLNGFLDVFLPACRDCLAAKS